jgi:hypothetical protein
MAPTLALPLALALRLDNFIVEQGIYKGFKARYSLAKIFPVIDNDLRVGMFLVDASAPSRKAF